MGEAFAAHVQVGAKKHSGVWYPIRRENDRQKAKFVSQRLENAVWDGGLRQQMGPFAASSMSSQGNASARRRARVRKSSSRRRLHALLEHMAPIVAHHSQLNRGTCLEWDEPWHLQTFFAHLCERTDILFFSPDSNEIRTGGRGSREWHTDLTRPLHPSFPRGELRLILATQVLEHVANPFVVVANLHELLAPGGALVLTAPFQFVYHPAPQDFFRYTHTGLETVAQSAGFVSIGAWRAGSFRTEQAQMLGWNLDVLPPSVAEGHNVLPASLCVGYKICTHGFHEVGAVAVRVHGVAPRIAPLSAEVKWLAEALPGICGQTRLTSASTSAKRCQQADDGSFPLTDDEAASWPAAARACIAHCQKCLRCRHISVSMHFLECSWFAKCNSLKPHSAFLTLRATRKLLPN